MVQIRLMATLLALVFAVMPCDRTAAGPQTTTQIAASDQLFEATFARALEKNRERPGSRTLAPCQPPGLPENPILSLTGDRVTGASILQEIDGFARSATTSGGLDGTLFIVTDPSDTDPSASKAPPVAGTLRAAVEAIAKSTRPGWIVFRPATGQPMTIVLHAPLRLPDNITLDGRCADVTITGSSKIGLVYIFNTRNVVITGLAFRKLDYVAGQPDENVESCIRLNGSFDAVAILHNDFERCADGVIDSTVSPKKPLPDAARVTIAYNFIRDHDKTMLFGTFGCDPVSETFGKGCKPPEVGAAPPKSALYLTLHGNLFYKTGQRHPRVYGRTYAHIANNAIIFAQQRHADGQFGSGYGVFVSNGAQAIVEHNVFAALGTNTHPSAVWTTTTPGAERMSEDVAGAIRTSANLTTGREIVDQNSPETVAEPIYYPTWAGPRWGGQSMQDVIACIAARAGRAGAAAWGDACR